MRATQIWQDALVHATRDITPTVREFVLRPADGAPAAPWSPGAHLPVQLLLDGRVVQRSYSLVDMGDAAAPAQGWRIAVKRLDDGRGGSRAMWRLAAGERLRVGEPQNHFALDLAAPQVLLVAGGIGVTPLVGMARTLAARGVPVQMVYAARSADELAYADTLRAVLGDALHLHTGEGGTGTRQSLHALLAGRMAALAPDAQLYTCGPIGLMDAVRAQWAQAGRAAQDLRLETFGASGRLAPQAFQVSLPAHGLQLQVDAHTSLLDALEAAGVDTISDCRRGECGLCAMDVLALDGEIDHRDVFLSAAEQAANTRMCVCVSRVVGRVSLDTAWRGASAVRAAAESGLTQPA